jgi:hypothetical protein
MDRLHGSARLLGLDLVAEGDDRIRGEPDGAPAAG